MQNFEPLNKVPRYAVEVAGATIEFTTVQLADGTPTGRQLALAAGLRNTDDIVILEMLPDGQLEDVRPDEVVNLQDSSRKFILVNSDRSYNCFVDGARLSWPVRLISGAQLRKLGNVPSHLALYQELTSAPDKLLEVTDLVDLDSAGVERFVSRPASWQLNVQGVVINSESPTISVRDALITAKFDVTQGWQIFLKVVDKPKKQVDLDTIVDLREPGIEKLRLTPKEVINGEAGPAERRDFALLDVDEDHLDSLSARWETVLDSGRRWLIIDSYDVPYGYTSGSTRLALEIPPTYPGAQIDMFYVYPPLALSDGREILATQVRATIQGIEFHGWSRHRGPSPGSEWKIGVDNVVTHLALVESALQKEVE
ncbi:hypothetical protein GTP41_20795 [Pseudoduganella sp. DS3]|uniref:Multi-ubiquitin domain-containing protein n=1 Tax=Pseudoduganella guangdongensis TaxID=2692179 RepID=A0A6N9HLR7_9BURK|nr:multiubiquitin domain-containing protein [Pseudoduganella guangdongensis]MYN04534.1 hypothetical protein [Pseudoduganella guangdongensis]